MRQFGIRDVLWFTALAAVALGWWADHRALSSNLTQEKNQHEALYGDFHALRAKAQILEEDLNALKNAKKN